MNRLILSLIAVSFTVLLSIAGQVRAESAMKQLQDASKGPREAASVFDGSRLR